MRTIEKESLAFSFALILSLWYTGPASASPHKTMPVHVSTVTYTGMTAPSPSAAAEPEPENYQITRETASAPSPAPQAVTPAPAPAPETVQPPAAPARPEPAPEAAQPAPARPVRTYTVWLWQETGDCLWTLAERFYGDPWLWKKIYLANKDRIADPRVLYPKQVLVIPYLEGETGNGGGE